MDYCLDFIIFRIQHFTTAKMAMQDTNMTAKSKINIGLDTVAPLRNKEVKAFAFLYFLFYIVD